MCRRTMKKLMLLGLGLIGMQIVNTDDASGYETAEYEVVRSEQNFEVRDYPDLMLAATKSKEDSQGRDGSFMRLFGYISGANESKKSIAMTTPVFMEKGKEDSPGQMGFVVPKAVASDGIPVPTNAEVAVRKRRAVALPSIVSPAEWIRSSPRNRSEVT